MEDIKEPVTPTEKVEEKLLTQKEVDDIVKDRVLREKTKFAKDLGIGEEFDKSKYEEFKKYLESQKTEAEKLAERNVELEAQLNLTKQEARQVRIERELDDILKELGIDTRYAKTILKLTDLASIEEISKENLKPVIENTINEELPMLVKSETIKVGAEPKETKVVSGAQDYLEKKYKNNPYFKI
jgi:hypothetical protein